MSHHHHAPSTPKPAQAWSHLKHEGQCVKTWQNVFKVRSSLKSKSVHLRTLRYENVSMDKGWKMHPEVSLKYGDFHCKLDYLQFKIIFKKYTRNGAAG